MKKQEFHFTENDIRPDDLIKQNEINVIHDRNFLLDHREEWVDCNCPACDVSKSEFYAEKNGFNYVCCVSCGTIYTNPRPSVSLLHKFYDQSRLYEFWNKTVFPASEEARRSKIFHPRAEKVAQYCTELKVEQETIIDIGAAFGTFCEEIRKTSSFKKIIALETTSYLAETCRERGFDVIEQPIEHVYMDETANVVTAFEVIEHLFSPREFIQKCSALLKKNGLLFLTCPNPLGFDMRVLKTKSDSFDHEHINYFTPDSLTLLLQRNGFKAIASETPGKLDAEIVRKHLLSGKTKLHNCHFLKDILVDRWDELGRKFQEFLSANRLSSHQWIVAIKQPAN